MTRQQMTDEQVGQILRLADAISSEKYVWAEAYIQDGHWRDEAQKVIEELLYQLDFCPKCGFANDSTATGVGKCGRCGNVWKMEPEVIR